MNLSKIDDLGIFERRMSEPFMRAHNQVERIQTALGQTWSKSLHGKAMRVLLEDEPEQRAPKSKLKLTITGLPGAGKSRCAAIISRTIKGMGGKVTTHDNDFDQEHWAAILRENTELARALEGTEIEIVIEQKAARR